MAFSGERYEISAGEYRAVIAEVGGALAGCWFAGIPVTMINDPQRLPPKSAGAALLPWPNRIRDGHYRFEGSDYQLPLTEPALRNASHGLVRWVRFDCEEHTPTSVTLRYDLVPQTGYPFEIRLVLRYSLDPTAGLTVSVTATNAGREVAPFGAGFHPYLDLADHDLDTAELLIPADTVLRGDDQQIPVERLPVTETAFDFRKIRPIGTARLDDGFTDLVQSAAVLSTDRRTVELHWDTSWKYLQVFTVTDLTPGHNAIAIEPMSCPANAFASGEDLVRLEPGADWTGSWGLTVTG